MMTRRSLIELAALGTAVAVASAADAPFALPKLPYAYDALEPFIDALTMQIHHDRHHQAYVDNLNRAVATDARLSKLSVEELLQRLDTVPTSIRTHPTEDNPLFAKRQPLRGIDVWEHAYYLKTGRQITWPRLCMSSIGILSPNGMRNYHDSEPQEKCVATDCFSLLLLQQPAFRC